MIADDIVDLGVTKPREALEVLDRRGAMLVRDPEVTRARCDQALADAREFFALRQDEKNALDIARSPHFRGYSTMHNERDWREQIHFGRELTAVDGDARYLRLQGPNLWPDRPAWRARMLEYLQAVEGVGRRVLALLATALGLAPDAFLGAGDPYLLMKLICYHPQPSGAAPRQGVAAHLDFSWITLTLQDDVGGLEVRAPDGVWHQVHPEPGTWLVNVGELLEYASRGACLATPHRVVNPSNQRARVSIPVFVNPALCATVAPQPVPRVERTAAATHEHVHRVLDPQHPPSPFVFGAAEWRRKGENVWCEQCVGPTSRAARPRG